MGDLDKQSEPTRNLRLDSDLERGQTFTVGEDTTLQTTEGESIALDAGTEVTSGGPNLQTQTVDIIFERELSGEEKDRELEGYMQSNPEATDSDMLDFLASQRSQRVTVPFSEFTTIVVEDDE